MKAGTVGERIECVDCGFAWGTASAPDVCPKCGSLRLYPPEEAAVIRGPMPDAPGDDRKPFSPAAVGLGMLSCYVGGCAYLAAAVPIFGIVPAFVIALHGGLLGCAGLTFSNLNDGKSRGWPMAGLFVSAFALVFAVVWTGVVVGGLVPQD